MTSLFVKLSLILNPFDRELLEVVKTGAVDRATMIADGCTNYWSFLNSYYFAGTVVTTLGYGNVYPATNPGKVCTYEITVFNRRRHNSTMTYLGFLHLLCNDWRSTFLLHYETNIRFSSWKVQATRKMCVTRIGEVRLGHFTASLRGRRIYQLLPHSSRCLPSYWRVDPSTGLVLYHDHTTNNRFRRLLSNWWETKADFMN